MIRQARHKLDGFTKLFISKMPIKGIKPGSRMFSLQESLPSLPVPPLDQTLGKYLTFVKLLVPDDQYQETQRIVSKFQSRTGPELQVKLLEHARDKENWLADWWREEAYLGSRISLPINVNPGACMPPTNFTGDDRQLQLAAHTIGGILDYKYKIDDQSLPVDYLGKRPLCMSQFYKILCASRVPRPHLDEWRCYPPNEPNAPRHIVILCKNRFYSMDVYNDNKEPVSVAQLYSRLKSITDRDTKEAPPVGILTTMQRDDCAKAYQHLCKDTQNASHCDVINRSIVVLCLDKPQYEGADDVGMGEVLQQLIHGCGSQWNTGNRWFDKTLQFIVGAENQSGLCYEHTSAEGPPIISLMDHVTQYVQNSTPVKVTEMSTETPIELKFNVDDTTGTWMKQATEEIDKAISLLQLRALTYLPYGKRLIKLNKLSPDAYIQQAFQLTYQRLHKCAGSTYETGSTRMFKEGRTDTIRSCTPESQTFVRAMDCDDVSPAEKARLLRESVVAHKRLTDETITGQAIDRHLLGLKLIARKSSLSLPDIFTDPSYSFFMNLLISTSQVSSTSDKAAMAYGPSSVDGYGVCYNPQDDRMYFTISTKRDSHTTDVDKYAHTLHTSLDDMMKLASNHLRSNL